MEQSAAWSSGLPDRSHGMNSPCKPTLKHKFHEGNKKIRREIGAIAKEEESLFYLLTK
jgi:hypothetical protein